MRSRYGNAPQIDLDKQIARVRVLKPMKFDFPLIARRVIENNMGIGGIRVFANATVEDGRVRFPGTEQSFPFVGDAATVSAGVRSGFEVRGFQEGDITLELVR